MSKLAGKVAVVTGASKGIGAGIARSLAREGAAVVVNYASDKAGAEKTVAAIKAAGGNALAVQGSVSNASDVQSLFAETKKAFGNIDILVNNAGVYAFAPLAEVKEADYRRMFDTNVLGVLLVTQEAAKHFGPNGGSVFNIGSVANRLNGAGTSVYSATKAALDSITQTLSRELGPQGIRVNAVNPGPVVTEGFTASGLSPEHEFIAGFVKQTPLGRVGQPDDIGDAVALLAADDARWITGQIILTSGGLQ